MTTPMRIDCLVIGGGPAGLMAAAEASRCGLEVMLVDERKEIAGLRDAGLGPEVTVLASSLAWSVFPDRTVSVVSPGDSIDLMPRTLVIATGAHDRLLPFFGWEHQSVVTADEGLDFARTLSARMRWVVAGIGEQGAALAHEIRDLGQDVLYADAAGETATGAGHASGVLPGHIITGVIGTDRIERVELALHQHGGGATVERHADVVCVAYARAPRVDLTWLAGCAIEHAPDRGGAVPVVRDGVCTSVAGVYIAGEAAGLCRTDTAKLEGQLAGLMAAEQLGKDGVSGTAELRQSLITQITDARRADATALAGRLGLMWDLEEHYVREAMEQGGLLCKCELVSGSTVRAALADAAPTPADLKRATRVGMGECQAMHCRWLIQKAVALRAGRPQTLDGMMSFRPPVRPITLAQLIGDSE